MSNEGLKENPLFAEEVAPEDLRWLSISAGICLIAFVYCTGFIRKRSLS